MFHGIERDDAKQHWFTCEAIQVVKQTTDNQVKIAKLETMFREGDLTWYMTFKVMTLVGQARLLVDIKQVLLKEF